MRDGVPLSHQRRQEFVLMDSEIRHLKKSETFMVTAGGWPVTKLSFAVKPRRDYHPALIERDLTNINHQVENLDKKTEILNYENLTNHSRNSPVIVKSNMSQTIPCLTKRKWNYFEP